SWPTGLDLGKDDAELVKTERREEVRRILDRLGSCLQRVAPTNLSLLLGFVFPDHAEPHIREIIDRICPGHCLPRTGDGSELLAALEPGTVRQRRLRTLTR